MSVNKINNETELINPPITTQGLNLPQRVLVLSIAFPINGSITNSTIRKAAIMLVMYKTIRSFWASFPVLNRCEVTKVMKNVDKVA